MRNAMKALKPPKLAKTICNQPLEKNAHEKQVRPKANRQAKTKGIGYET